MICSLCYFLSFLCPHTGVCQLVNKMEEKSGKIKAFNRNDEEFLEAFVIFCGLGIQNTQMYEAVERAMAKQMVTLEVSPILGGPWLPPKRASCSQTLSVLHVSAATHRDTTQSLSSLRRAAFGLLSCSGIFCLFLTLPADSWIWCCVLTSLLRFSGSWRHLFLSRRLHTGSTVGALCCVGRGKCFGTLRGFLFLSGSFCDDFGSVFHTNQCED